MKWWLEPVAPNDLRGYQELSEEICRLAALKEPAAPD